MILHVIPTNPAGQRVIRPAWEMPPGVLRPIAAGGVVVSIYHPQGLRGPGWFLGGAALLGEAVISLPGCDGDPEAHAARVVRMMRFPTGPDADRLGELLRAMGAAKTCAEAAAKILAAGDVAAEIRGIRERAGAA